MGSKVVVRFSISEMGGALRQVRDLIVNPTNKVVVGDIAVKPLVKGLILQQVVGGKGRGCRTFELPPHGCHVASPEEECAFPHIKKVCYTIVVQETACHI